MHRVVNRQRAVHQGDALREEHLAPSSLGVNALAVSLAVTATHIHEIVEDSGGVTAGTPDGACGPERPSCPTPPPARRAALHGQRRFALGHQAFEPVRSTSWHYRSPGGCGHGPSWRQGGIAGRVQGAEGRTCVPGRERGAGPGASAACEDVQPRSALCASRG